MNQTYRHAFYISLSLLALVGFASVSYGQRVNAKIKAVAFELKETQGEISQWEQKKKAFKTEMSEQESTLQEQRTTLQSTQRNLMKEQKNTQDYQRVGEYLGRNVMVMHSCLESIAAAGITENSYEVAYVYHEIQSNCDRAAAMMDEIRDLMTDR